MDKFAVALGGGGARGLAHIGVLKVLDQHKIKIDAISGCSMGAIVGGLYAYFGNAEAVEEFVINTIQSEKYRELGIDKIGKRKIDNTINYLEQFFDFIGTSIHIIRAINKTSYFDETLTNEIFDFIPDVEIETLKIKFFAVASDLLSGQEIIISNGNLRKALQASSAIPGIFPPIQFKNYLLVDGSVTDLIPIRILRNYGYEKILAINVVKSLSNPTPPKNILEVLYRVESISSYQLSSVQLSEADILINPDVREYDWSDFSFARQIILEGEKVAKENLYSIKNLYNYNIHLLRLKRFLDRIKKK